MKFSMGCHAFTHSRSAFKCTSYNSLFNVSFLIYKNLILSVRQRVYIFPWVIFVAGEVYGVLFWHNWVLNFFFKTLFEINICTAFQDHDS